MANGNEERDRRFIPDGMTETVVYPSPQERGGFRPTVPKRNRGCDGRIFVR